MKKGKEMISKCTGKIRKASQTLCPAFNSRKVLSTFFRWYIYQAIGRRVATFFVILYTSYVEEMQCLEKKRLCELYPAVNSLMNDCHRSMEYLKNEPPPFLKALNTVIHSVHSCVEFSCTEFIGVILNSWAVILFLSIMAIILATTLIMNVKVLIKKERASLPVTTPHASEHNDDNSIPNIYEFTYGTKKKD